MARLFSMIAVLVAVCILCSGDAWAKGGKKQGKSSFEQLDKNNDGKISLDEFKAGAKDADRAAKQFKKFDKNGDGFLDKDEFKALEEARKEHQKKK